MHRSRLGKVCAALAILLAFVSVAGSRAGAQMAELLPGAESSASSSVEPGSGSGGAADAAANCCPPLPAPQPMGFQRRRTPPDRNADAQASAPTGSDSSRPSAADPPSVRKAPWFLEEDPALSMVGGSGAGGSDSGTQNPLFPPPTALPESLDPVNRFVVAQWQRGSADGAGRGKSASIAVFGSTSGRTRLPTTGSNL